MIDISKCPCGQDKTTLMNELMDEKLNKIAKIHLAAMRYDLVTDIDMDEMSLLLSYKKAFDNKTTMCNRCCNDLPLETICSRIITILNK